MVSQKSADCSCAYFFQVQVRYLLPTRLAWFVLQHTHVLTTRIISPLYHSISIRDNCKLYNMQGSDFHLLAESFCRRFEDRYKKICADYDTGEGTVVAGKKKSPASGKSSRGSMSPTPNGPITLDARVALGAKIFKLSGMELGHAINIIELHCPQALVGGGADAATKDDGLRTDELEIDIDAIDSRTFNELSRYVSEALSNGGRSSVVRRAGSSAAVETSDEEEEFEHEEEEDEEIVVAEAVEPEWDDDDDEEEVIVKHKTKKRRSS